MAIYTVPNSVEFRCWRNQNEGETTISRRLLVRNGGDETATVRLVPPTTKNFVLVGAPGEMVIHAVVNIGKPCYHHAQFAGCVAGRFAFVAGQAKHVSSTHLQCAGLCLGVVLPSKACSRSHSRCPKFYQSPVGLSCSYFRLCSRYQCAQCAAYSTLGHRT